MAEPEGVTRRVVLAGLVVSPTLPLLLHAHRHRHLVRSGDRGGGAEAGLVWRDALVVQVRDGDYGSTSF